MQLWQVTWYFLAQVMADLTEHDVSSPFNGVLEAVYCGLFIPPTSAITPGSKMSDISEANYDGYARQLVVWFAPWQSSTGVELLAAGDLYYTPTDATVPNTITGVFLASALSAGNLLMAATLPGGGIPLSGPGYAMKVQPQFSLSTALVYGGPVVVS